MDAQLKKDLSETLRETVEFYLRSLDIPPDEYTGMGNAKVNLRNISLDIGETCIKDCLRNLRKLEV